MIVYNHYVEEKNIFSTLMTHDADSWKAFPVFLHYVTPLSKCFRNVV